MKPVLIIVLLLFAVPPTWSDSRAWPPGPTICTDKERSFLLVFDPVLQKDKVVGTNIMHFEYTERYSKFEYACTLKRSLKVFIEPDFAFMATKDGHIVMGSLRRGDFAIAVLDANRETFVWTKTLDDLFPSRKKNYSPQWSGSVSREWWLSTAEVLDGGKLLRIITEKPKQSEIPHCAPFENSSVITVDLETFEVTINQLE